MGKRRWRRQPNHQVLFLISKWIVSLGNIFRSLLFHLRDSCRFANFGQFIHLKFRLKWFTVWKRGLKWMLKRAADYLWPVCQGNVYRLHNCFKLCLCPCWSHIGVFRYLFSFTYTRGNAALSDVANVAAYSQDCSFIIGTPQWWH